MAELTDRLGVAVGPRDGLLHWPMRLPALQGMCGRSLRPRKGVPLNMQVMQVKTWMRHRKVCPGCRDNQRSLFVTPCPSISLGDPYDYHDQPEVFCERRGRHAIHRAVVSAYVNPSRPEWGYAQAEVSWR